MKFNITDYNTIKNGFSKSSLESVPIGEGDCGANVWIEEDGNIHLLLSKSDTFSESGRLAKLGYLKIGYESPVFSADNPPILLLNMSNGTITICDKSNTAKLTIAAFVGKQLFGIKSETQSKNSLIVSLFNYRDEIRELLPNDESAYSYMYAPFKVRESADIIINKNENCLAWCHHNQWSYHAYSAKNQHLTDFVDKDPIINTVFGCVASGNGFKKYGEILKSENEIKSELYIMAYCEKSSAPQKWLQDKCLTLSKNIASYDFQKLIDRNRKWWTDYFTDYYIYLYGTPEAEQLTRGYTLQKYMQGCAGRGKFPIKFNGSIFTVHPSPYYKKVDYDYRKWGEPYWIQNTRLIYWNMLYSGDFEGMLPFFDFVCSIMPQARAIAKSRYGHSGINLPETVTAHGLFADSNFGYGKEKEFPPQCNNNFIGRHYNGQLEIAYMMLKFKEYTKNKYDDYFEEKLLPFINEALLFFKNHFQVVDGKLLIQPTSSLETWQNCVNDTPNIAGLMAICRELRRIGKTPCIDESIIPEIPRTKREMQTVIAPCAEYIEKEAKNCETPELYTMFPFDIYTFDMSLENHKLLTKTFDTASDKFINGWSQRLIQAAILGKTDYCIDGLIKNFNQKCDGCFFDAYFGPNFDWTPDQCHGSATSLALIYLLLNSHKKTNSILPENWKAEFKLP